MQEAMKCEYQRCAHFQTAGEWGLFSTFEFLFGLQSLDRHIILGLGSLAVNKNTILMFSPGVIL